jgi:hypothetical protein
MQKLSNLPITLDPEEILTAQFMGRRRSFSPPMLSSAQRAIDMSQQLVEPAAVYDEFLVLDIEGEEVVLAEAPAEVPGEASSPASTPPPAAEIGRLRVGPKVDLLRSAERVLVSVDTIGPALGKRVDELHASGAVLDAYMLDCVGVVALGAVGEALRKSAEQRAAELGWGVGAALSPGSLVGWSTRGQRDLCALLPLEAIRVHLNDQCVLRPLKSGSMLIGLGPDYKSSRVGSICRYCSAAETCWRRRRDPE